MPSIFNPTLAPMGAYLPAFGLELEGAHLHLQGSRYLFVYPPPDLPLSTQPTVGPFFGTRKRLEEKTLVIRLHSFEVLN